MDNGKSHGLTAQQRRVRQQVENILDLADANWRDELSNPEVNDAVERIIRAAEAGQPSNAAEKGTVVGIGIAVIVIAFGIIGAITNLIGGWFWWIGGGIMIAVISAVIGIVITALKGKQ